MSQKIEDKARAIREQRERREVREMQDKAIRKLSEVHQLFIELRNYSDNSPHGDRYRQASNNIVAAYEQI